MGCGYNVDIPTNDFIIQIVMNIILFDIEGLSYGLLDDKHIVMPLETCFQSSVI